MPAQSISCPHLNPLPSSLAQAASVFSTQPTTALSQPWASSPEAAFKPGHVSLAHDLNHLAVWADLDDDDIFNHGTASNQPLWSLGDVFEIFLRPRPGERYIELHVTPNNIQLRLAFPSELFFWREACFHGQNPWIWKHTLPEDAFQSETAHRPGGWQVYARIPWTTLGKTKSTPTEPWTGCFCRYDASRTQPQPILSTTGSHLRKQFHDQRGWNSIRFTA